MVASPSGAIWWMWNMFRGRSTFVSQKLLHRKCCTGRYIVRWNMKPFFYTCGHFFYSLSQLCQNFLIIMLIYCCDFWNIFFKILPCHKKTRFWIWTGFVWWAFSFLVMKVFSSALTGVSSQDHAGRSRFRPKGWWFWVRGQNRVATGSQRRFPCGVLFHLLWKPVEPFCYKLFSCWDFPHVIFCHATRSCQCSRL